MDWSSLPRETVRCALCGSDDHEILSVARSWPVARCTVCGLVYLGERPVESSLEEVYGTAYYEDGDVGYRGYMEIFRRYESLFRRIFERRRKDLERRITGRRLLEVGCAYGLLLDHLRSRGWTVSGVEISPVSASHARDRLSLDVRTGSLESAGYPSGSFDAILMLDVLEHLHRPFEALGEVARLLAPGGTLVVQCPWELSHWEEVMQAVLRGMRTGSIEPDAVPAHLYFFSPRTLDAFLEKGGFEITGRQSGNYGEIRRRVSPPVIRTGSAAETAFRFAYYRLGVRALLYSAARATGLGNGLIRYARPSGARR